MPWIGTDRQGAIWHFMELQTGFPRDIQTHLQVPREIPGATLCGKHNIQASKLGIKVPRNSEGLQICHRQAAAGGDQKENARTVTSESLLYTRR